MSVRIAPARQPGECLPKRPSTFTSLQWLVIAMGARDGSVPLQWSMFGRMLQRLLADRLQGLADPCLETLRRTAALARQHGWDLPAAEIGLFLRAGWTEVQLEVLIESVHPDSFTNAWPACEDGGGELPAERRQSGSILYEEFFS